MTLLRPRASLLLTTALVLGASSLSTAKDEEARARAGAKAFRAALAKGWAEGALRKRLARAQVLQSQPMGQTQLYRISGKATEGGFEVRFESDQLSKEPEEERKSVSVLRFSAEGRLVSSSWEGAWGGKTRTNLTTFGPEGKSELLHRVEGEPPEKPIRRSYDPDSIPLQVILFLAPLVREQLPAELHLSPGSELEPGRRINPEEVSLLQVEASEVRLLTSVDLWRVRLSKQGEVLDCQRAPKSGGPAVISMSGISQAKAKALEDQRPLLIREAKAAELLVLLRNHQRDHFAKRGRYARKISNFKAIGVPKADLEATGYRVVLKVSPDGREWIALAKPTKRDKTGRYSFLIASRAFRLYRIRDVPQLPPDCKIPKGAEPLH